MPSILIPVPLRKLTNNVDSVIVSGTTVLELINNLELGYSGIKERLCFEDGSIRNFINIFVNGEDIRFLQGIHTTVKESDEISIMPAIAGG